MAESDFNIYDPLFITIPSRFKGYMALIECPDGETYLQPYDEIEDLINLSDSLGDGFFIAQIY